MNRRNGSLLIVLLIFALLVLVTLKPHRPIPESSPLIEDLMATARSEASKHFNIAETQMVLFAFSIEYGTDWLANNITNEIYGYHVQFFDPATVAPDENNPGQVTAINLSIMLSKDGRYRNRSTGTGRGIGWSISQQ